MIPDFVPLYGVVIVLASLIYFSIASITFLFVRLDIPEVARLFRGLFNAYFWVVPVASLLAAAAFAASGRIGFAAGMLMLVGGAVALRGRTLRRIDAQRDACEAGDSAAARRLRTVHWAGMAANFLVIASIGSSVPFIL